MLATATPLSVLSSALRVRARRARAPSRVLPEGGRTIINPGSVGQPRDRDPRASFAVLDLGRGTVEFPRVEYDIAEAMRRAEEAGLPGVIGERLAIGA